MNLKPLERFFRDFKLPISALGTITGAIFTFIGISGVFLDDRSWVKDNAFFDRIGNWDLWCLILGGLLLIMAGYYLYDYLISRKRFAELIDTPSKSKILHNFEEIDKLAYRLGSSHIVMWKDIKRKHKIRK
ncbi:MAG: DUF3198 domain-containing protein [Thermoplasmata archaeon]|nr:DUF3198 domain-containing protein [Thermoplasmata archaeon]